MPNKFSNYIKKQLSDDWYVAKPAEDTAEQPAQETTLSEATNKQRSSKQYIGIRGWLAAYLIITIIGVILSVYSYYSVISSNLSSHTLLTSSHVQNSLTTILGILLDSYSIYLILKMKKFARLFVIITLLASDIILALTAKPQTIIMPQGNAYVMTYWMIIGYGLAITAIPIVYFAISKRVKQTLVKPGLL